LIWRVTQAYASEFHRRLTDCPTGEWPSDLQMPFMEFDPIASCLTNDVTKMLGVCAVNELLSETVNPVKARTLRSLMPRVRESELVVLRSAKGEIHRILSVVEAKISSAEGLFLVQLASWKDDVLQVQVQLPQIECVPGSLPVESLTNFLSEQFPEFDFRVEGHRLRRDRQQLEQWPMTTSVLRTVFDVTWTNTSSTLGQEVDVDHLDVGEGQFFGRVSFVGEKTLVAFKWCDEKEFASLLAPEAADVVNTAARRSKEALFKKMDVSI